MSMTVRDWGAQGDPPAATDDFIGRGPELEKITGFLLNTTRLITLVGPGGIGKTRLAAELVRRYRKAKRRPVFWARLARLTEGADSATVEDEIASAVLDVDYSVRSTFEALVDMFSQTDATGRHLPVVLVIDNCEHVIAGVGDVVARLLASAPGLIVLATSRTPLGWADEQLIAVPPLTQDQAVTLFKNRATLVGYPLDGGGQISIVRQICRNIDNHPLYIRLAAARLLRQPLTVILRELSGSDDDQRLEWPQGPQLGIEPRHRRIADVITWSYNLCQEKERLLLDRMSVFAAGHDLNPEDGVAATSDVGAELEAIAAVCGDPDAEGDGLHIPAAEVASLLERLVDQSLVSLHLTATAVRYSLLESIRVFAAEQLRQRSADEPSRLATRHLCYYHDKIVGVQTAWFNHTEQDLLIWARAEWDNIITAIETSIAVPAQATRGLAICVGLIRMRVPFFRGSMREMRSWTERTLEVCRTFHPESVELQISGIALTSLLAFCQGDREDAERLLEECVAMSLADYKSDWRNHPEVDLGLNMPIDLTWGVELFLVRSDPMAIVVLARAGEQFRRLGDYSAAAMAELFQAFSAALLGTPEQARHIARKHLDHAIASGAGWAIAWAELIWAITLTKHGEPAEALALGRGALTRQLAARDQWGASWSVELRTWALARIIADGSLGPDGADPEAMATEIARLVGGNRSLRARFGIRIEDMGPFARESQWAISVAREVLDDNVFNEAETEGGKLRIEQNQVQRLALGKLTIHRPRLQVAEQDTRVSPWHQLSAAEQRVAILAAAGWTNAEIGSRRGTSVKTVNTQMSLVLQKLSISSRTDILGFIPETRAAQLATEVAARPRRHGNSH